MNHKRGKFFSQVFACAAKQYVCISLFAYRCVLNPKFYKYLLKCEPGPHENNIIKILQQD